MIDLLQMIRKFGTIEFLCDEKPYKGIIKQDGDNVVISFSDNPTKLVLPGVLNNMTLGDFGPIFITKLSKPRKE